MCLSLEVLPLGTVIRQNTERFALHTNTHKYEEHHYSIITEAAEIYSNNALYNYYCKLNFIMSLVMKEIPD